MRGSNELQGETRSGSGVGNWFDKITKSRFCIKAAVRGVLIETGLEVRPGWMKKFNQPGWLCIFCL
ncbi:hypothetical protein D3A96_10220 [Robertkochia marina]|nr:hypothetical protein D3A96_10220 [Robertkochia marina]